MRKDTVENRADFRNAVNGRRIKGFGIGKWYTMVRDDCEKEKL